MNRATYYHDMTTQELQAEFANKKQELFNLRFQHSTGQLKNPLLLNTVKKDIARVLTVLKEREEQLPRNKGKRASAPVKVAKEKTAAPSKPKADVAKKGGAK